MSNNLIHLDLVNHDKLLFSDKVEYIIAEGQEGDLGISYGHSPLLTFLKPGVLTIRLPGEKNEQAMYIAGGMLEVMPSIITILADETFTVEDIDSSKLEPEHSALKEGLEAINFTDSSYNDYLVNIAKISAQLRFIKKFSNRNK